MNIVPGKIYRKTNNSYLYDKYVVVTEVKMDSLNSSYVEYMYVQKPGDLRYSTMNSALAHWEEVNYEQFNSNG